VLKVLRYHRFSYPKFTTNKNVTEGERREKWGEGVRVGSPKRQAWIRHCHTWPAGIASPRGDDDWCMLISSFRWFLLVTTARILKICSFCHIALADIPFCFLVQNFAEIGQSVDELWPKNRFSRWRPPPSWILIISIFGHVTVIGFNIWCSVPNFIKIGPFLTEIWRFNDFQNGGRPPSWILKICSFLSCSPRLHTVLLPHTKCRWNRTISRWVMAKKSIFKMAAAAILNFKNFNFWSRDCNRVQYLM